MPGQDEETKKKKALRSPTTSWKPFGPLRICLIYPSGAQTEGPMQNNLNNSIITIVPPQVGVSDISGKNYRMPINRHLSNYRQNYRYRKIEILKLSKNYRYRKMPQNLSDKYMESQTIRK